MHLYTLKLQSIYTSRVFFFTNSHGNDQRRSIFALVTETRAGPSNIGNVISQIVLCKQITPDFYEEELCSIQKDSEEIRGLMNELQEFMPQSGGDIGTVVFSVYHSPLFLPCFSFIEFYFATPPFLSLRIFPLVFHGLLEFFSSVRFEGIILQTLLVDKERTRGKNVFRKDKSPCRPERYFPRGQVKLFFKQQTIERHIRVTRFTSKRKRATSVNSITLFYERFVVLFATLISLPALLTLLSLSILLPILLLSRDFSLFNRL